MRWQNLISSSKGKRPWGSDQYMAWYPTTCCGRPDEQGNFQHIAIIFIKRASSGADIQHGGGDSEVQPSQVRDQQRVAPQPYPPGCDFSYKWHWTKVRFLRSWHVSLAGSCPTCSLGTDTSATTGLCLRPGKTPIIRLRESLNTNQEPQFRTNGQERSATRTQLMFVRLALCQDLLAQSCLSGFSLIRLILFCIFSRSATTHVRAHTWYC